MDEEELEDQDLAPIAEGDEDDFYGTEEEEDPLTMGFHEEDEPESDF